MIPLVFLFVLVVLGDSALATNSEGNIEYPVSRASNTSLTDRRLESKYHY